VYIEVQKVMYGLPQAGILANQLLARSLAIHGYHQTNFTPGLGRHFTHPIQFTLVVDYIGVQYVVKEHAQHIIDALEMDYTVSKDWDGSLHCGITLKWDENKYVDLSIPGYISRMPFKNISIPFPSVHSMRHTTGLSQLMATASSMPRYQTHPLHQTPKPYPLPRHCGHAPLQ
jgi:hypothetical protein